MLTKSADAEDFLAVWRWCDWNDFRIRCVGAKPCTTVWINDLLVAEIDLARLQARHYQPMRCWPCSAPAGTSRSRSTTTTPCSGRTAGAPAPGTAGATSASRSSEDRCPALAGRDLRRWLPPDAGSRAPRGTPRRQMELDSRVTRLRPQVPVDATRRRQLLRLRKLCDRSLTGALKVLPNLAERRSSDVRTTTRHGRGAGCGEGAARRSP